MRENTKTLIATERRKAYFGFITAVMQRGKIRTKKYKHDITIPDYLYEELRDRGIINMETYYIDEAAFFEYSGTEVTISFVCLYACEDLHRRILTYLVVKFAGSCPIKRGGRFF